MKIKTLRKINKIKKVLHPKRLKIAEQILIVLFIALLIPMIISGIVINNINQQAMRHQLRTSADLIANMVSDEIDVYFKIVNGELTQINTTLSYLPSEEIKQNYLKKIKNDFSYYADLKILNSIDEINKLKEENKQKDRFILFQKTTNNKYLAAVFNNSDLNNHMFKSLKDDARQIYIIDNSGKLIAQHNYTEELFKQSVELLPKHLKINEATIYGNKKNQPISYIRKTNPEVTVIVNTTEKITKNTINENRFKLLMAVFVSTLSIFIIVALYIYYMYINIRQLFKGIMAVSKGSYERRIRLLKSIFTPYEIVFLASEFNKMASEIHKSYIQLKEQNVKLEQLNEFRSNLIDTVSHELRTPLTSIQGYTSRLLRTDIQIDEETRQKSLRIIKRQSERLKRLIEDLLVIPDIERDRIRVALEPVWISDTVTNALTLVKNNEEKEIVNNISEDFPLVIADKDRAEQIIVNLVENAVKYSKENTPITIDGKYHSEEAIISISNQCDKIPEEKLNSLFEKFIRMDDKTTRTTRGTGLGLFIVKGLVEAMNGKIKISSTDEVGFNVEITLPLFKSVTLKP
ncbi:GHKL domain-containing protein [bacterium]|nr:GHKL domain-containing protein [bacterium]